MMIKKQVHCPKDAEEEANPRMRKSPSCVCFFALPRPVSLSIPSGACPSSIERRAPRVLYSCATVITTALATQA